MKKTNNRTSTKKQENNRHLTKPH